MYYCAHHVLHGCWPPSKDSYVPYLQSRSQLICSDIARTTSVKDRKNIFELSLGRCLRLVRGSVS